MMHTTRSWLQLALLFCGGAYAAPIADPPATGKVLVATANLHGTSFEKTVILITQYDRQGTLGVTINRPAHRKLIEFFPDLNARMGKHPLYLGGPVHSAALFVLARTHSRESWIPVLADLHFTGGATAYSFLKQAQNDLPDSSLRVYAGYAGWAAGQLENEIQRGDWLVTAIDPALIFTQTPERTWDHLYRLYSGKWI